MLYSASGQLPFHNMPTEVSTLSLNPKSQTLNPKPFHNMPAEVSTPSLLHALPLCGLPPSFTPSLNFCVCACMLCPLFFNRECTFTCEQQQLHPNTDAQTPTRNPETRNPETQTPDAQGWRAAIAMMMTREQPYTLHPTPHSLHSEP
jgi:hypothetical protein